MNTAVLKNPDNGTTFAYSIPAKKTLVAVFTDVVSMDNFVGFILE